MTTEFESLLLSVLHCSHGTREALVFGKRRLSYDDLLDSVRRTMALLNARGVNRGDRVAFWLHKSPESVILLLAIMGVGAAYVPIDPTAPADRVATLLCDCKPRLLVTGGKNLRQFESGQAPVADFLELQEIPDGYDLAALTASFPPGQAVRPKADDLAAILYTSGSTGAPKGVMLSHGNISSFVAWAVEAFGLQPDDRFTSHAPLHFDLSTFDLFAAFHVGGAVCLIDEISVKFPAAVHGLLLQEGITAWYSVPTALRMLVEHGPCSTERLDHIRLVLFAGEVFQPAALRAVMEAFPNAGFFNLYGPTETNVCTFYRVPRPLPEDMLSVPIGIPCPPLEVGIYDEAGLSLPDLSTGEICVTGPGVMLGYWGHEELTRQKRLRGREDSYRTGDFGYRMPDGNIVFTGRRDNQVKFRGYRIELLEIEAAVSTHPDIGEAAALVTRNAEGDQLLRIVATTRPGSSRPGKAELARHIAGKLPPYCIPDQVTWLDEMPRTSTGKVDRTRLQQL